MTTDSYFAGVYGFMQISMQDIGLLDDKGLPFKRAKYNMSEQDAIKIYIWIGEKIKHVDSYRLKRLAQETDKRVSKLINDHRTVNNFLLSIMLLRLYLDNLAPLNEQLMILPKINRLIDVVDSAVSDEEFSPEIKRTTARTAENIYRQWVGKPMLSDEVFNTKFKGIRRKNEDTETTT